MSNRDGSFLKIFVSVLLRLTGVLKSQKNSVIVSSFYTVCLIYCSFGAFIGFLTADRISNKLLAFTAFLLIFDAMILYNILFWSRRELQNLLALLKGDGIEVLDVIDQTGEFVNSKIIVLVIMYFLMAICLAAQTIALSLSHEVLRIIPFWYSCGNMKETSKLLRTFCWQTDTKIERFYFNTLQVMLTGMLFMVYSYGVFFCCIIMAELYIHTNRFKREVTTLIEYTKLYAVQCRNTDENSSKRILEGEYEKEVHYQFVRLIRYQVFLRRCARKIIITLEPFISFFILEFFAVGLLLIFMICDGAEKKLFLHKCVEYICCGHGLISFAMACYFGQIISEVNEVIFDKILQIPWYEQDVNFRKLYINVLIQNGSPIQMKLFNTIPINFSFFLATLKFAYSVLNLMFLQFNKYV